MFLKYQLRKPFSRKIRLDPAAMTDAAGRARFLEKYSPILHKDPLAGTVGAMAMIYSGKTDAAEALMQRLSETFPRSAFATLFATSDIRKFMMAVLRAFYADGKALTRETAQPLAALSAAFDPESGLVLDPPATGGGAATPLSTFAYESRVPENLKVGIYFRSHFYPASRPHDLAYRFQTAFAGAGVQSEIVEPDKTPSRVVDCDIALIDDPHVFRKSTEEKRAFLEKVRARAKCLVMVEMDPWAAGRRERLAANKDIYDIVWAMMPSLMDDDGKIDGLAASCMLFPVGAPDIFARHRIAASGEGMEAIKFCGGIEEYNFLRYFWIVGACSLPNPPGVEVTNHAPDDKDVADSLDHYIKRLGASRACLNFVRRATGKTSMVGRTSDALCLQQLLVQEASPEVSAYLTPGQHFLEFLTLEDLDGIVSRLNAQPHAFEEIRRAGAERFDACFSDAAVVRHLATWC